MAINQLNLPAIYQAAEQTKAMQSRNALADYTLGNTKQFNALAPQIAAGDNAAYSEGLAVNPEGAMNLRTSGATDQKRQLDEFGRVAGHILSLPPEQRPQAWATTGRNEVQRIFGMDPATVPAEYDEGQLKAIYSRVADMSGGQAASPLGKLADDFKAGRIDEATYHAAVKKATAQSAGTSLTVGEDGTITFNQGGAQVAPGQALNKPVQNKVQEKAFDTAEGLANLRAISDAFDPSFLEVGTKMSAAWTAGKEKFGMDVSEGDKKKLAEFTTFKRNALSNLNEYIKRITGAALSEAEAVRIMAAAPHPGQGIFDGDGPTEFDTKMKATIKELELANARAIYASKVGLNAFDIQLTNMRDVVNKRYNAEYESLKSAGMDDAQAKAKAREMVKAEFGL